MDGKMLARLGAVVFVAVAVTATAIEMTRQEEDRQNGRPQAHPSAGRSAARRTDPLPGLGEAGPRDPACLRAWAENRNRFLAPGARPTDAGIPPRRDTLTRMRRTDEAPSIRPHPRRASQPTRRAKIMGGTGVIDHFLEVFTRYIDSGFGLLSGEVAFIATTLIVIDVTLAALFWSWGADDDIIARLVKKTLFVGVFAYIISNWNNLARIIFESFAGLGLKA
jgi:conjugative transfer region protein TrbK